MTSIRNRNGVWQARVIRKGFPTTSKSFTIRQEAERWARQVEAQMDQGRFVSLRLDERTVLGELVTRHMNEVTPLMKSAFGGRIICKQCQATSKRSRVQCRAPAMR